MTLSYKLRAFLPATVAAVTLTACGGSDSLTPPAAAGGAAAGVGLTTVITSGAGAAKRVDSGLVYALGNVAFTGTVTNPVGTGESGILIFATP